MIVSVLNFIPKVLDFFVSFISIQFMLSYCIKIPQTSSNLELLMNIFDYIILFIQLHIYYLMILESIHIKSRHQLSIIFITYL